MPEGLGRRKNRKALIRHSMFRNTVRIAVLTRSMKTLPTNGTAKYALGATPYFPNRASMLATAFGVAPRPKPQVAVTNAADS